MNVIVLNASPKVETSITMQYVKYMQQQFSDHSFSTIHIGKKIKGLARKPERFDEVIEKVSQADLVLWDFPVYYFLAPSQLVRFMELVFERDDAREAFAGRYTAAISSSKHFFDHTAHNWLQGLCEDLGMKYVGFHSAEMADLKDEKKRADFRRFGAKLFGHVEQQRPVARRFAPVQYDVPEFRAPKVEATPKLGSRKIMIVTDAKAQDRNLNQMIEVFLQHLPNEVEVINLNDVKIKGGCLGCLKCCSSGECVYRDDYQDISERMLKADGVIYAMKIGNRYFSADYKTNLDRHFCHGHRPVSAGQHVAYIVSGPLRQLPNLEQIMTATAEVGRTPCSGVVTDEDEDSELVSSLLEELGRSLLDDIEQEYVSPWTFLGKGGHMIFRDLVMEASGGMSEDYRFYKKHGLFDYPYKDYKNILQQAFIRTVTRIPAIRSKFKLDPQKALIEPLQKALEQEAANLAVSSISTN